MKRMYYDLFEDEISEIIKEAAPEHTIIHGFYSYSTAHIINYDGIYSNGNDLYTVYINGKSAGYIHKTQLINRLTHETFEIWEEQKNV